MSNETWLGEAHNKSCTFEWGSRSETSLEADAIDRHVSRIQYVDKIYRTPFRFHKLSKHCVAYIDQEFSPISRWSGHVLAQSFCQKPTVKLLIQRSPLGSPLQDLLISNIKAFEMRTRRKPHLGSWRELRVEPRGMRTPTGNVGIPIFPTPNDQRLKR